MTLMQLETDSQLQNLAIFDESDLSDWEKNLFPKQFWTKFTGRGQKNGYGTEAGYDSLVFKSFDGYFLGEKKDKLVSGIKRAGPTEKFEAEYHKGNLVALQTDDLTYISCEQSGYFGQGGVHTNKKKVTDNELFYVYKTNACAKKWDTPDNGSDCIALKNKATGNWLGVDTGTCGSTLSWCK